MGHSTKYSCLPTDQLQGLDKRLADTGVAVTVLPAMDLFVMGRHFEHSVFRGVADANALLAYGVNCSPPQTIPLTGSRRSAIAP